MPSVSSHVYDPLRYTPRMDPGAPRTGGKLGKQLTFPGGDPLVRSEVNRICMLYYAHHNEAMLLCMHNFQRARQLLHIS